MKKEVKSNLKGNMKALTGLRKLKGKGGPKDLSAKFDEYLYGGKK